MLTSELAALPPCKIASCKFEGWFSDHGGDSSSPRALWKLANHDAHIMLYPSPQPQVQVEVVVAVMCITRLSIIIVNRTQGLLPGCGSIIPPSHGHIDTIPNPPQHPEGTFR